MADHTDDKQVASAGGGKTTPQFVHLRVHSAFSLLEGALPIKKIIGKAVSDEQPAIGIADTNNLFAALEFSLKCMDDGIQPLIGCQLSIDMEDEGEGEKRGHAQHLAKLPAIVLIAASEEGYTHLVNLVSKAYLDGEGNQSVRISMTWLREVGTAGLIALTGASGGPIDMALKSGHMALAETRAKALTDLFGDRLYVELQRHGKYDRRHEGRVIDLAYKLDLPLVATNEPFFPSPAEFEAHDALMAVAHNAMVSDDSRFRLTPDHYLKSRKDMAALFADLPEALDNTVEIARRCTFVLKTRAPILPRFTGASDDPAEAERAETAELRRQAVEGLDERIRKLGMSPGYTETRLSRAAGFRARRHRADEVSRLLPDRCRLHQMGEEPGHSGWAGPWFRCGFAGRLCTDHHRRRSACASRCCSNASSTRNASRCPTSTSTSARTGAKR